ncbi:hypothetical protein [Desulfobulbus sp.]|uniref:hypothetical protein n=1 Tax=Desulfobulbus sp. TaxID=895 RepID=UPI00286EDF4B|nr:hypothetical protein [Desulfobulbus sp.]
MEQQPVSLVNQPGPLFFSEKKKHVVARRIRHGYDMLHGPPKSARRHRGAEGFLPIRLP